MEYLNGQDCSLLLTATGKGHIVPPVGPGQGGLGRIPVQVSVLDLVLSPPRIDPSLTLPSLPLPAWSQLRRPFPGSHLQVLPGRTEIPQVGAAKTF